VPDTPEQLDRLKVALADRYRIERELGRGGMAVVYLAEDRKLERQVAIKVLKPELAAAIGSERFLREVKLTARLEHPHILTLHDSGDADGFLYYVMPFAAGESLRERLNREQQLPLEDALQIAREVADALHSAHTHEVVHRDIKPENIMLEEGHAVVADFGIARAITAAGGERLTETGVAVGTPAYMSPEQAAGSTGVDQRSDEYALGCVVYEMLAGEPPFTGPTTEAVLRKQMTAALPDIQADRPGLAPHVVGALSRALAKAPADRFTTVAQFAEALTPRGGMTPPAARPVRTGAIRSRTLRIGVAAAVVIVVAGVVLLFPRGRAGGFDANRVLVVAFADESGREETTTLGRMSQDYIIQVLTEAGFAEVVDPLTALAVSQNVAVAGMVAGPFWRWRTRREREPSCPAATTPRAIPYMSRPESPTPATAGCWERSDPSSAPSGHPVRWWLVSGRRSWWRSPRFSSKSLAPGNPRPNLLRMTPTRHTPKGSRPTCGRTGPRLHAISTAPWLRTPPSPARGCGPRKPISLSHYLSLLHRPPMRRRNR
jgi:hypothetical protein